MESSGPPFADVSVLVDGSQVVRRPPWLWYSTGLFLLFLVVSAVAGRKSAEVGALVAALCGVLMVGVMLGTVALMYAQARSHRAEQQAVEAIEELVQLRRWPQAVAVLQQVLGRPMRSDAHRAQALIYLAAVLARYHQFADAIHVQEYLLGNLLLDEGTAHGLRLGRAMALLRDDRLVDADRAIGELRRSAAAAESGGLALVEMYRDVKTGHPAEALEMFDARLPLMRQQLGHRVADAYALAARAYDFAGREAEARVAFERATLLCPWPELRRRYPEVRPLEEKFEPVAAPAEMA